jgi:hypothetical protein
VQRPLPAVTGRHEPSVGEGSDYGRLLS